MRLLLIHQALAAPDQPGGTRHYELGQHLIAQGHAMTVVTSDLNYMTGKAVAERQGVFVREEMDGIAVLRAYTYPSLHRSFVWRVVSFLSFMLSSLWAGLNAGPVDVVMGTTPPIFQAVTAWLVAALRRKPFLLEVRDLWPEFAIDLGVLRNPTLIQLSRWLESFLYNRAATSPGELAGLLAITSSSEGFRRPKSASSPMVWSPTCSTRRRVAKTCVANGGWMRSSS